MLREAPHPSAACGNRSSSPSIAHRLLRDAIVLRRRRWILRNRVGLDEAVEDSGAKDAKRRRAEIRIVVAREVFIPDSFLALLAQFPNLTLLDVQDATVAPEFWANLEELPNVSHVLATNAIPSDLFRNISISLPEVKFWLGQHRKLVIGSKAAMNPGGTPK